MNIRRHMLIVLTFAMLQAGAWAYPPDQLADARKLLREKKYDEAATQIQAYLAANRFDGAAWSLYGVCQHMQKKFDNSIAAGQAAIALGFNQANEMYNIACAYAVMGKPDLAIEWLRKSMDAGFTEQETLERDDEMATLRDDPRFIALTGLKPPVENSAEKRWAYDLDFLVRRMEQMHWDLYAKISKDAFRAELDRLKIDAPSLGLERVKSRLAKIVALVGDGHTTMAAFAEGEQEIRRIPLHLELFRDGLHVIGAPESQKELVGAKVQKIGGLSAEDAIQRVRAYCSVDNDMGYLMMAPPKLNNAAILQEIGAIKGDEVEYTFRSTDGKTRTATVSPVPIKRDDWRPGSWMRPNFVYANATSTASAPLFLQHGDKSLWFQNLEPHRTVYFGFHAVADNDDQSFEEFVTALMKEIDQKRADNLIVDMRLNGGGNTGLVLPLIHALIRNDRINKPGHLFVIIGRNTFSAAQNTVNLLELHTHATFVGEPSGSRPNFVGESTYIVLPYSKLRVYCSSRYWQHVVSTDRRNWVQPQIAAEMSFDDFAQNRDPCMDAILKRIAAAK